MTTEQLEADALGTTRLVHAGDGVVRRARHAHGARRRYAGSRAGSRPAKPRRLPRSRARPRVPRLLGFDGAGRPPQLSAGRAAPRGCAALARVLRRRAARAAPPAPRRNRAQRPREGSELARDGRRRAARSSTSSSPHARAARTASFRRRAYEDLRHLLKHKRTYQPQRLTARQRGVLARPTCPTRLWRALVKPPYRLRDARRARLARARRPRRAQRLRSPDAAGVG